MSGSDNRTESKVFGVTTHQILIIVLDKNHVL